MSRMNRDELFMFVARLFAKRSTCTRLSVGAVATQDNRIVSTGYVGSPSGMPHCATKGCKQFPPDVACIRTIHAEANTIAFAAKTGVKLMGATLYTTDSPCLGCAKLIISAGFKEVVYERLYRDQEGLILIKRSKTCKSRRFLLGEDSTT